MKASFFSVLVCSIVLLGACSKKQEQALQEEVKEAGTNGKGSATVNSEGVTYVSYEDFVNHEDDLIALAESMEPGEAILMEKNPNQEEVAYWVDSNPGYENVELSDEDLGQLLFDFMEDPCAHGAFYYNMSMWEWANGCL